MHVFEDREDLEEWLEELSYVEFWHHADALALDLPCKSECDEDIAGGRADAAVVLSALKAIARLELLARHDLQPRERVPWMSLH